MATNFRPKRSSTRRNTEPRPLLRWIFRRQGKSLTCAVDVRGNENSYDVCVVPHWNVSSSVVEVFDRPIHALQRHAQVSRSLREAGWVLAAHAAPLETGATGC
jgi:hypothetical protein